MELSLDIGGLPILVADTAGLRQTEDVVESIGVQRAENASASFPYIRYDHTELLIHRVRSANVSICVLPLPEVLEQTTDGPRIRIPQSLSPFITADTFYLFNKSDLLPFNITSDMSPLLSAKVAWTVSMSTGDGAVDFLDSFAQSLTDR